MCKLRIYPVYKTQDPGKHTLLTVAQTCVAQIKESPLGHSHWFIICCGHFKDIIYWHNKLWKTEQK